MTSVKQLSTSNILPTVNLSEFLQAVDIEGPVTTASCRQVADCLKDFGCLIVRDPRVDSEDSSNFTDMMEAYFSRGDGEKAVDSRAELSYQVGYTPAGVELPRAAQDEGMRCLISSMPEEHRATLPSGPDCKCRFMWPLRGRSTGAAEFLELNAPRVAPSGIDGWEQRMDGWGSKMLAAAETVAEMAAIGLGLPRDAFLSRMRNGPHVLAPTGADLSEHGKPGACLAGFHYDLNFLTIHGKSRFPGLFVWLRDGRRAAVSVPDGCLLLQAGKQLEWLTGGAVMAGMHEVVCTEATCMAVERARSAGRSLWRVSSTVFSHIASDVILTPLGGFRTPDTEALYPPTLAGHQVQRELEAIELRTSK